MVIESKKYPQGVLFRSNGEQIVIRDAGGMRVLDYSRINYRKAEELSITFLTGASLPVYKKLTPDGILWETIIE